MAAAQRKRAFGSIANLGKGLDGLTRWRIRWREGGKRRTEVVHGSRREAELRLSEIHARVGSSRTSSVTVGHIYETCYLPHIAQAKAPGTRRNHTHTWDGCIGPRWASVPVADVRAGEVEEWLQGFAPNTARISLTILRWCMRRAVMRGDVASSPLEMPITLPTSSTRRHDREIIRGGIGDYLAAVRGSPFEAAFILGACAGLRPGEMLGVKVGEVELREVDGVRLAVVRVAREAAYGGGVVEDDRDGMERERVKTERSRRWAVVREPYASRLAELQDEARQRGDAFLADDGFGRPLGTYALRYGLDKLYAAAGLRRILPRNLRPTFATEAHHSLGMSTEDVARLMGHSKPVITWSTYERPDAEQVASLVARASVWDTSGTRGDRTAL